MTATIPPTDAIEICIMAAEIHARSTVADATTVTAREQLSALVAENTRLILDRNKWHNIAHNIISEVRVMVINGDDPPCYLFTEILKAFDLAISEQGEK